MSGNAHEPIQPDVCIAEWSMTCCVLTEWATVLFVIQLSLGESIWSPRWYDYSMSVAPEGREGVFTAMASAPLFLGKFVTGEAMCEPTCHNWVLMYDTYMHVYSW